MGKELTKEQACKRLGISVRSLQRATQSGKLQARYHRGKSGKMEAFYDSDELDHYKEELAQVVVPERKTVPAPTGDSEALTPIGTPQGEQYLAALHDLLGRVVAMQERPLLPAPTGDGHTSAHVGATVATLSLADKLTLSLMEAAQLSGLSRGHLREAIDAGKLKARIIGRGWRVKRDDLDAYVKKL